MNTHAEEARPRPRPEARVARKILLFDLKTEAAALKQEAPWRAHGHNAKTLVRRADSRIVLAAIRKGHRFHQDKHPATIAVQTESGHIRVHVGGEVVDLQPGMLLSVAPDIAHDVEATQDSLLLLTFTAPDRT